MISSAIAQGQGGMSLGEQWALAAMLRGDEAPRLKKRRSRRLQSPRLRKSKSETEEEKY